MSGRVGDGDAPPAGQLSRTRAYAELAGTGLACIGCAYLLVLHMALGRPIWLDEFLQFAIAADTSSGRAWALIRHTILNINHNQTGIYMMLDYWLEAAGGASAVLLRLPSLLCGCFFFVCVVRLFRQLGYSVAWMLLALIALLAQQSTLYYIGEARPYFPLAAATLGTLVYYLAPPDERRGPARIFGWTSILIGTLFHPYFSAYWAAIVIVTLFHRPKETSAFHVRALLRHADIPLCVFGSAVYFALALSTWMRHAPTFTMDPFEMVKNPSIWINFADYMHFQFVYPHLILAVLGTTIAIGAVALVPARRRGSMRVLATPCLLIAAMLALSLIVSVGSYLKHYWIIPRQWVASAAILPLAVVWLWAELGRVYARLMPGLGLAVWLAGCVLVAGQARRVHAVLFDGLATYVTAAPPAKGSCDPMPAAPSPTDPNAPNLWVALANENIRCGGAVWPVFRKFYGEVPPS